MSAAPDTLPRLDHANQCLWWGAERADLSANAFRMLAYLVERPHQLVTKATLLDAIWPESYVVDAVLSVTVSQLREALRDDARQPRFIETVHRRGYRWIGALAVDGAAAPAASPSAPAAEVGMHDAAEAALVGRDPAHAELASALARATSGRRQVVFVTGEPGIGKTALLDHFLGAAAARGCLVARGQCIDAYGLGEAYMPLLDALQQLVQASGDTIEVLRSRAPTWLLQLPGLLSADEHDALQRALASSSAARMMRELQQALETLAAARTIVLVLEDLHWSDPSTVSALAGLAMRREPARLLVVGTYRPVDAIAELHTIVQLKHELTAKRQSVEIALDGFSTDAVHAFLAARFARNDFPPELAQRLQAQTSGNPLFLLNAVEDLEARGWLASVDGTWRCTVTPERVGEAVPESTRAMIDARLARVPDALLTLLEAASVAGSSFASQTLAAATLRDATAVEIDCTAMARAGRFVKELEPAHWPDGTSGAQYAFRHALYQQVLHGRVTGARRQALHRAIAARLELGFGTTSEIAGALALHYELGGDVDRAVTHHAHAAQVAQSRYSYEQAAAQLRHALDLLARLPDGVERDAREIELQSALVACVFSTDGPGAGELEDIAVRIETLSRTGETTVAFFNALFGLIAQCITRGDLARAGQLCERVLERAAQVEWGAFFANVGRGLTGFTQHRRGELDAAVPNLTVGAALPMLGATGIAEPSVIYASDLGFTLILQGELARGLALLRDADARADATGHPPTIVFSASNVMRVGQLLGDRTLVEQVAVKMGEIGDQLALPRIEAYRLMCIGWLQMDAGEAAGVATHREGAALLASSSHLVYAPYYAGLTSAGLLRLGRVDDARATLDDAFRLLDATDARWCEPELHRLHGAVAAAGAGDSRPRAKARAQATANAERSIRRAIELARAQGSRWWELRAWHDLARLLPTEHGGADATRSLREVHAAIDDGGEARELTAVRTLLARTPA